MDLATVDKLLTTTRTVRKRLDLTRPVDPKVIKECLNIATQAPIGANIARYHFVIVTDPDKRAQLATLYRKVFYEEWFPTRQQQQGAATAADERLFNSSFHLVEHLHEVPLHIIPCVQGRPEGLPP